MLNAPRIAASTAAALLVIASAGFGSYFAWQSGSAHGWQIGSLSVAMALGLELCKPLAVSGALTAMRSWRTLGHAAALSILALLAVTFSLTAELSLMAALKGDAIAERVADNDAATIAKSSRARLEADLANVGTGRASQEIRPQIDTLMASRRDLADCQGWLPDVRARGVCIAIADLRTELARAERREHLEADLAGLNADAPRAEKAPDAGAKSLSTYLAALGLDIKPGTLSEWMTLIPVVALELGAAFSLLLVQATNRAPDKTPAATCPNPTPVDLPQTPVVAGENTYAQGAQLPVPTLAIPEHADGRLVKLLSDQGGKVFCSQRSLANAIGVSHGTVGNLLADMTTAGSIKVTTSKRGTMVELLVAA